jgi:hypothetical protein
VAPARPARIGGQVAGCRGPREPAPQARPPIPTRATVTGQRRVAGGLVGRDALAWCEAVAHDEPMTTPSRSDRHAARLARLRTARYRLMVVGGVTVGLAAGLSLALFSDEQPLRVAGVLVLAVNAVMLLALPALLRTQPTDWRQHRRREPPSL